MVSFSCESCGDVLTKKKLDSHRAQCRGAFFSCLDCQTTFHGTDYRSHTSCISEAQKYEKGLYKGSKGKKQQGSAPPTPVESQALVPRNIFQPPPAPDNRVAIVDAPPAAPSPPPAVNVFDFLITDGAAPSRRSITPDDSDGWEDEGPDDMHPEPTLPDPPPYTETAEPNNVFQYQIDGFEYGSDPIKPGSERFDSYIDLPGAFPEADTDTAYTTPAPSKGHSRNISMDSAAGAKKRKRGLPEDLDLSGARGYPPSGDVIMTDVTPALHSGLTGGLRHLLSRTEFPPSPDYSGGDGVDALPMSPLKRPKTSEKDKERSRSKEKEKKKSSSKSKDKKEKSKSRDRTRDKDKDKDKPRDPKRSRRESDSKRAGTWVQERRRAHKRSASPENGVQRPQQQLAIEYNPKPSPTEAQGNGALIVHPKREKRVSTRAELFLTFVTKGPDSERGCSINKALKRFHRERGTRVGKPAEEKELWKVLRLRRNERGEVVLFAV